MPGRLRLDFGNLPLVEAVIRASFAEPIELRFSKIADVHKRLRDSFPHITEPQEYEAAPGISEELAISPGRITGVAFTGHPKGLRATLQSRVAVVRWLKQFVTDAPAYPRFPVLQGTLWELTEAVQASYGLESLRVAVVNMSYVNFIHVVDFATVLTKYFSDLVHIRAMDDAEEIRKVEISWREKGIDLRLRLEKISARVGGETMEGCRLTTVAGMNVSARQGNARATLEDVHDRLQVFFRAVISDYAKDEWQLQEQVLDA